MTNADIIAKESERLVQEGVLGTINYGGEILPEPIHTFQGWKELGYKVKKGEHSEIRLNIWKHTTKTKEVNGEEKECSTMFMKNAAFFKMSQVEKMVVNN